MGIFGRERKKNKKLFKEAALVIKDYIKDRWDVVYFLRHVLCFLRWNSDLLKQKDYKDLYEETIALLIIRELSERVCKKSTIELRILLEVLADIQNKDICGSFEFFSINIIDDYLALCKKRWGSGEKYTQAI